MDMAKIRRKAAAARTGTRHREDEPTKAAAGDAVRSAADEGGDTRTERSGCSGHEMQGATGDDTGAGPPRPVMELLCFRLGPETYAFHLRDIQEIAHLPAVAPVPGTPHYVSGVCSLRGKMVPVVDLKARLNITAPHPERTGTARHAKLIIVKGPKGPIGARADAVVGVRRLPEAGLAPPPAHIEAEAARMISGVVISEETFVTIINVEEALAFTMT